MGRATMEFSVVRVITSTKFSRVRNRPTSLSNNPQDLSEDRQGGRFAISVDMCGQVAFVVGLFGIAT
jgi:hypothetical protein